MAGKTIVIDKPMETLSLAEQEDIWRLSRTNDVFCTDANGILWQVIDCTDTNSNPLGKEA